MLRNSLFALVAVLVVAAAFGAGYVIRGSSGLHPAIYIADRCDTGETGGSCFVGGTGYGFETPPNWTDSGSVFHDSGWPTCMPQMSSVKGLRIAADWLYVGSVGKAVVFWVDCRNP
jgi:hypothetical protein